MSIIARLHAALPIGDDLDALGWPLVAEQEKRANALGLDLVFAPEHFGRIIAVCLDDGDETAAEVRVAFSSLEGLPYGIGDALIADIVRELVECVEAKEADRLAAGSKDPRE